MKKLQIRQWLKSKARLVCKSGLNIQLKKESSPEHTKNTNLYKVTYVLYFLKDIVTIFSTLFIKNSIWAPWPIWTGKKDIREKRVSVWNRVSVVVDYADIGFVFR